MGRPFNQPYHKPYHAKPTASPKATAENPLDPFRANQQAHENAKAAIAQQGNAAAAYHAQNEHWTRTRSHRAARVVRFVEELRGKGIPDEFIFAQVPDSEEEAAFQSAADRVVTRFREVSPLPATPASGKKPALGAGTPGIAAFAQSLVMPADPVAAASQPAAQPPTPPAQESKPALGAATPGLAAYAQSITLPR